MEIIDIKNNYVLGSYRTCNYSFRIDEKLLIIIDLFTGTELSVTNCIDEIFFNIGLKYNTSLIKFILFKDTLDKWDIYQPIKKKFIIIDENSFQRAYEKVQILITNEK